MLAPGFVQALVTYADTIGDNGVATITAEFNRYFALVTSGNGKTMITTAVNGKSFDFQINATAEELFAAFGEALREINGTKIGRTYADFSQLQR